MFNVERIVPRLRDSVACLEKTLCYPDRYGWGKREITMKGNIVLTEEYLGRGGV